MRLKDLRQLERADLARQAKVARDEEKALRALAAAEHKASRKAAWAAHWPRWTAWWESRAKEAKIAATVVGSVLAVMAGLPRIVAPVGHWARRAWSFYARRDVGPPAQPPPTGIASTTIDRVPHPSSPRTAPPTTKD